MSFSDWNSLSQPCHGFIVAESRKSLPFDRQNAIEIESSSVKCDEKSEITGAGQTTDLAQLDLYSGVGFRIQGPTCRMLLTGRPIVILVNGWVVSRLTWHTSTSTPSASSSTTFDLTTVLGGVVKRNSIAHGIVCSHVTALGRTRLRTRPLKHPFWSKPYKTFLHLPNHQGAGETAFADLAQLDLYSLAVVTFHIRFGIYIYSFAVVI